MARLIVDGAAYEREPEESVLETFLRHGVEISYSCQKGTCFTCMLRAPRAQIPPEARQGLRFTLVAQGYFLACAYRPTEEEVTIERPRDGEVYGRAIVRHKEMLAPRICRLLLETATPLYYHPGQFINLRRQDGLTRSYSLASVPRMESSLELHIKRMNGGAMSNWIFDQLSTGDTLDIGGPHGNCFYLSRDPEQPILLIGTGTGLAPLYGILRDALHSRHRGPIYLYHGSRFASGLYLRATLEQMSGVHEAFDYFPCLSGPEVPDGFEAGRADEVAFARHPSLKGFSVFLCGAPEMVHRARKRAYLAGAQLADINAEAFDLRDLRKVQRPGFGPGTDRRRT